MQKNKPFVSIIIPLKTCNDYLEENISATLDGSYQKFEILVLPDGKEEKKFPKTRTIPTGEVGPAEKRDKGAKLAKGDILAFIDDDAFPSKHWLQYAVELFESRNVAAVCGPGVTPPNDSLLQKVSGAFSASLLGGGPYTYRFIPQKQRYVDDYPSMNFLVRKEDFWSVGGFDTNFWPGEDTKFCHDLVVVKKEKMLYDPRVLVYHHRRAIFGPHLAQNGRYGLHRGYFARILPKTSFRLSYFIPAFLLIGLVASPFLFFLFRPLFYIDFIGFVFYLCLVVVSSIHSYFHEKDILIISMLIPTTVLTHLFYGAWFLKGFLFTRHLRE